MNIVSTPNSGVSTSIIFRTILTGAVLFASSACQAHPSIISSPVGSSTPTLVLSPTSTEIAAATPTNPPTLTATQAVLASIASPTPTIERLNLVDPKVVILAENLSNPDDLVLAPEGSIYISDLGSGSIRQYLPGGKLRTVLSGLNQPEGMVFLPGDVLVIAEQGKNRVLSYNLISRSLSTLIVLKNKTSQPGLDGIALDSHDPANPSLVVPDSPNGTILRSSLDGKTVSEIAHGFSRPTAAWVEKDGSILVVDEYAHSLTRIHPDGSLEKLAQNLPTPDDVVEDKSGHIFVNTLADGAIHVISVDGSQSSILVSNLASPQGEVFDLEGNLVVTDPGHGRLVKIMIH